MGVATSLYAIGDALDPSQAFWSVLLTTGKRWSEHQLIPTLRKGQAGVRKLDWGDDLVSTGDIKRVKEITLHCPDGRAAVLDISERATAFQFKTKSMNMLGAGGHNLEFQVIGRVIDKMTGTCECFVWDYRPEPGAEHLLAYTSSIYAFGSWRSSIPPLGALAIEVQGLRV